MKSNACLLGLILLTISPITQLFAQKNFQPGTVTLINGETLQGEINYQNWKQTPSKITFRKDAADAGLIYGPKDISSFAVANKIYQSAVTEIDKRSDYDNDLKEKKQIVTYTDNIFLATVISGTKPLYLFDDGVEHLYIQKDGKFELLRYKKYIQATGSAQLINEDKEYLVQLAKYLTGCNEFPNKLKATSYTSKSIKQTFIEYYNCTETKPEYVIKKERSRSEFGVFGGISNTSLKIESNSFPELRHVKLTSGPDFTGGLFFDVLLARQLSRISFNNELMYSSYSTGGYSENNSNPDYFYSKVTYNIQFTYLKLNNMVRYRFLLKNGSFYLNAGLSQGLAINDKNTQTKYSKYLTYETTTHGKIFNSTRKYEQGYVVGAGGKMKRFSLEARMEKGNGISSYSHMKTITTRYFALLGYRIK